MTDLDELVAWLRQQLDADERMANRIGSAPVHGVESPAEAEILHFADPDRIRRDVAAARHRIEVLSTELDGLYGEYRSVEPVTAIELLQWEALRYADRPGYRQEWAP